MTKQTETAILNRKDTHKLVRDVLSFTDDKDCIDAYYDVLLVAEILKGRMDRNLGKE